LKHNVKPSVFTDAREVPVLLAAASGHLDCVKLLLDSKADPDVEDSLGHTAVYQGGHANVVRLLVKRDANVKKTTLDGMSTLAIVRTPFCCYLPAIVARSGLPIGLVLTELGRCDCRPPSRDRWRLPGF
jgi:hypothetical protein